MHERGLNMGALARDAIESNYFLKDPETQKRILDWKKNALLEDKLTARERQEFKALEKKEQQLLAQLDDIRKNSPGCPLTGRCSSKKCLVQ